MSARAFVSRSEDETFRLAARLASEFQGREVVLLTGDLGAGKTVFAKGVASGAGVMDVNQVSSPSFTLVNIYEGRHRIFHIDLYRLDRAQDILDLGWEEYLGEGIVLVEWAEKIPFALDGLAVHIEVGPGDERRISIRERRRGRSEPRP